MPSAELFNARIKAFRNSIKRSQEQRILLIQD